MKYNYVYKICNIVENKFYIGVRSCNDIPEDDLGVKYFSSSKDKNFLADQKNNKHNYRYIILGIFETREDALLEEINLHTIYEVANNPNCYNIVKQNNKKFDTTGFLFIDGNKISSSEYKLSYKKYHSKGKVSVKDKNGKNLQVSVNDEKYLSGEYKFVNNDTILVKDLSGKKLRIPTKDFLENKGKYFGINKGKFIYKDKNNNYFLVDTKDPRVISGELVHYTKGLVYCKNLLTGEEKFVDKKTFDSDENLVGKVYGTFNGSKNPNAKIIKIYNNKDEVVYKCHGNFKKICKENNLPLHALIYSYENSGKKIYLKKNNDSLFKGWYAIRE